MLTNVLKKIGLGKSETQEKPDNGDVTSKSFGGMGRDKLKKDILKHKGMGKSPIPTAAGLALKQKQEIEKATAKIQESDSQGSTYGAASFGSISSLGITSSSLEKSSSSISMPLSPMMQLDETKEENSFEHLLELPTTTPDTVNKPSLSSEANMTFEIDQSIDIPSDSEIESAHNSQNLDFPGYSDVDLKSHILNQKVQPQLDNFDDDTIEFTPSGNHQLTIEKTGEKESFIPTKISDINISLLEKEEPSLEFNNDFHFEDTPSITLDISPEVPNISGISKHNPLFSSRVVAETVHTIHNEDLTGKDLEFAQELATIYSEGNLDYVIQTLREHLNQNDGTIPQRFWYMLMDCYQVEQNKTEFEKVAIAFAYLFSTSPPSWFESDETVKKAVMSGKNIMILEPHFKLVQTEKFKTFLLAAKEENFCRINVSPCKFELSEYLAIEKLYDLFKNLRKNKVLSVLMGDNNLINFCKTYINPNLSNKMLKDDFLNNEKTFWLLYLEILQWKGMEEEFEELALEFAMKFEISPPSWEKSGIMSLDKMTKLSDVSVEEETITLDKSLTSNNIDALLQMITHGFETSNKAEVDLSNVDTIDFAAAGSISYQIQELWSNPSYSQKKVIFKYPNEMILTLLEMVGVTEFVEIFHRKR